MPTSLQTPRQRLEVVCRLVAAQVVADPNTISPCDDLFVDVGFVSMEDLELVLDLEQTFSIKIEDAEAQSCRTVADVAALVERKLAEKAAVRAGPYAAS